VLLFGISQYSECSFSAVYILGSKRFDDINGREDTLVWVLIARGKKQNSLDAGGDRDGPSLISLVLSPQRFAKGACDTNFEL
jgi:hypothetical protein